MHDLEKGRNDIYIYTYIYIYIYITWGMPDAPYCVAAALTSNNPFDGGLSCFTSFHEFHSFFLGVPNEKCINPYLF